LGIYLQQGNKIQPANPPDGFQPPVIGTLGIEK